jgi:hypothetical protein
MQKPLGLASPNTFKEVIPMRKCYFLFSIFVLSFSLGLPQTLRAQCMPNSNITPSNYVPFTSIYYISAPDAAGDLLVVGSMTAASYSGLSGVPLPNNESGNQLFCNPITLAPGIVANAYVPTAAERTGNFSAFNGLFFDPTCTGEGCPYYYPSGVITFSEIPAVFAWRIPPTQPGPPVYVSTGISNGVSTEIPSGQILAVDGSSGVTSVLFTSPGIQYYDFEGLAVGPDNLIYVTCPDDALIFRIDKYGGSLDTVYQKISGVPGPYEPQGPSFTTTGLLDFNTADYEGVWQISFDSSDNPSAPTEIIPPPGDWWGTGTAFNLADELLFAEAPWGTSGPSEVFQQTSPGAGTAAPLITSNLSTPIGVAVNSSGNIFVANLNNYQYSGYLNAGYIAQFDSQGNYLGNYVNFSCYSEYGPCDTPTFMQFDASGRLYVVTGQDAYGDYGKVWRVDPCGSTTCTPTLLIDLSYAYSTGTVPGLNWNSAVGVAVAGTGTSNSYTTPPVPIPPTCSSTGCTVTTSYNAVIPVNTYTFPPGTNFGDTATASIAVNFQEWNPTLFNTTRLPTTLTGPSSNTWSGGTPVYPGTTCIPIAGTGGNCIVIQVLCYAANGAPILPCEIFAPSGSLIGLMTTYQTQASQPNPGVIIADDGQNDWANITTGFTDPTINGGSKGLNTDTSIVNLGVSVLSPPDLEFGTVYPGTITVKSVTVTNPGPGLMTITDPFIWLLSGGDSHEFVAVNLCPRSLAAGKSCRIDVALLAGPNYGIQTAVLNVRDSGPYSPQDVFLSATVINPRARLSSCSLNFGKQGVSTTSGAKEVTLTNTGTTPLDLSTLNVTGDFALYSPLTTCTNGETLTPKASCTIAVTFTPPAKGPQSGSVVITDNARNSPQTIRLSGTGD